MKAAVTIRLDEELERLLDAAGEVTGIRITSPRGFWSMLRDA